MLYIKLDARFVAPPPFIDSFGPGPLLSQYQWLPSKVSERFKHILVFDTMSRLLWIIWVVECFYSLIDEYT